jgi:hypothetical protein
MSTKRTVVGVVDVTVRGDLWHKAQLRHKESDVEQSLRCIWKNNIVKMKTMLLSPTT